MSNRESYPVTERPFLEVINFNKNDISTYHGTETVRGLKRVRTKRHEMRKKEYCRQCKRLDFYDRYFCNITGEDVELDNHCKYYKRRIGRFWTYKNSPF